jgi:hypothetical protein
MPQAILPLFSKDMIIINNHFAVKQDGDFIYWFQGSFPVFCHHVRDQVRFRSFCCQMINLGNATSAELARALNVNHEKLSRWARKECLSGGLSPAKSSKTSKKKPMS